MKTSTKELIRRFGREYKCSGMELEFVNDEGTRGFAVYMSGHYEINEMKVISGDLEESNKFFERAQKPMDTMELLQFFHRNYRDIAIRAEVINGFSVVVMHDDDGEDVLDPIELAHRGIHYGHIMLDEFGAQLISDHNEKYNTWFCSGGIVDDNGGTEWVPE